MFVVMYRDEFSGNLFRLFESMLDAEKFISYLYECWEAYPMNGEAYLFKLCGDDECG